MNKEEMIQTLTDVKEYLVDTGNYMIGKRNEHPRPKKDSIEMKKEILSIMSNLLYFISLLNLMQSHVEISFMELLISLLVRLRIVKLDSEYNDMMDLCDDMDEIVKEIVPVMRENIKKSKVAIEFVESCTEEELKRYLEYKIN